MKAITSFFRSPDNHVLDFQESLQEIYNAYVKDNCAPTFITAKAKYLRYTKCSLQNCSFFALYGVLWPYFNVYNDSIKWVVFRWIALDWMYV